MHRLLIIIISILVWELHLQIRQAATFAMQLLDLIRIADIAIIQRRLLGIVCCLQVLQIALMPKLYIAVWSTVDVVVDVVVVGIVLGVRIVVL